MILKRLLLLLICLPVCSWAQTPIKFSVPNFPPYAYHQNNEIKGEAIDAITSLCKRAGIPIEIELTATYGRALHNIRTGKSDGMFLATQNKERDAVALFSLPVTHNNWAWYTKKDYAYSPASSEFKSHAKVGTILATNTHKWLLKNKFNVGAPPPDAQRLLRMFEKGRYDAVFLAERVFEHEATHQKIPVTQYSKHIELKRPFGIYLAKRYLKQYPEIMKKINNAILSSGSDSPVKSKH